MEGNFRPVSIWTMGNGTLPRKALRHKATRTVESLPIDHNTAGFRKQAYASRMM